MPLPLQKAPPSDRVERVYVENYKRLIRENYVRDFDWTHFEEAPWTPLRRPVRESRVALVATVGVHLRTDRPFDIDNPNGDPTFREIPDACTTADLTLSHDGYDTENCLPDINCVFPIDRLHELAREGIVGSASPVHFSCMGYIPHVGPLMEETAPEAGRRLRAAGVDVAVCVPT